MKKKLFSVASGCMTMIAGSALIATLSGSVAYGADTLLVNGRIYTANPAQPWVEALAITDGRIEAVGKTSDLREKAGGARILDLHGRTVIPGIVDSHTHVMHGSLALHGLNLSTPKESIWPDQEDELVSRLRAYAKAHPADKILFARANFYPEDGVTTPSHELLDRAVADRPVIVYDMSVHAVWLNAKALALAGVTVRPNANPMFETGIVRNADGTPRGVLLEASMQLAEQAALQLLPREELLSRLREGARYLNRHGITSVVNATGSLSELGLYGTLRDRNQLTIRMRMAFGQVSVPQQLTPAFLRDMEAASSRYDDDWLSAHAVKFFADDVSNGKGIYTPAQLQSLMLEFDRRGYQLLTHAVPSADVHLVLNIYEQVKKTNGPRDRRWRIEHAYLIEKDDISRFAQLGVIASLQPSMCCEAQELSGAIITPWGSLLRAGAAVAFGSDWPVTFPPDPFVSIFQTSTRNVWQGRQGLGAKQAGNTMTGKVNAPAERISVAQSVDSFTRAGAFAAFRDDRVGSLEVGKLADLAVLSQDVFSVPVDQIDRTSVTLTMVGGKVVYDADHP